MAGFFSSAFVQELARSGRSRFFSTLVNESGMAASLQPTDSVGDVLDVVFAELARSHRNEYVFKAAIVEKILLGRHNLNTAVMLTEFRVGECKADVVILNGTSTAYEIKSDRDNLDRLSRQVSAYLQAFARVNVVASDRHISRILELVPTQVGVIRLTSRGRLSSIREAVDGTARIDPITIFDIVQLREATGILRRLGVAVPDVPNTRMHGALRKAFSGLEATSTHASMVATLRATRSHKPIAGLLDAVPRSLHAAALTTRLRRTDHTRLCAALDTNVADAMGWA